MYIKSSPPAPKKDRLSSTLQAKVKPFYPIPICMTVSIDKIRVKNIGYRAVE
jgi:hypothetical protein